MKFKQEKVTPRSMSIKLFGRSDRNSITVKVDAYAVTCDPLSQRDQNLFPMPDHTYKLAFSGSVHGSGLGQCDQTIRKAIAVGRQIKAFGRDSLSDEDRRFATNAGLAYPQIPFEQMEKILSLWDKHHRSDLNAGTHEQTAIVDQLKSLDPADARALVESSVRRAFAKAIPDDDGAFRSQFDIPDHINSRVFQQIIDNFLREKNASFLGISNSLETDRAAHLASDEFRAFIEPAFEKIVSDKIDALTKYSLYDYDTQCALLFERDKLEVEAFGLQYRYGTSHLSAEPLLREQIVESFRDAGLDKAADFVEKHVFAQRFEDAIFQRKREDQFWGYAASDSLTELGMSSFTASANAQAMASNPTLLAASIGLKNDETTQPLLNKFPTQPFIVATVKHEDNESPFYVAVKLNAQGEMDGIERILSDMPSERQIAQFDAIRTELVRLARTAGYDVDDNLRADLHPLFRLDGVHLDCWDKVIDTDGRTRLTMAPVVYGDPETDRIEVSYQQAASAAEAGTYLVHDPVKDSTERVQDIVSAVRFAETAMREREFAYQQHLDHSREARTSPDSFEEWKIRFRAELAQSSPSLR